MSEFDQHSETYTEDINGVLSFSGRGLDYFTKIKAGRLVSLAKRHLGDVSTLNALDVGCGVGLTDSVLVNHFQGMYGVDVSKESVKKAAESNANAMYQVYDGQRMAFPDGAFDLTFAICVMHHVPPDRWLAFLGEMYRVTRQHGLVVIFEHNPWNPLTRHVVNRCPLDENAVLLSQGTMKKLMVKAGLSIAEKAFILFAPFPAAASEAAERPLRWLPLGAQYYVAARKP